jgi:hypothetical protein
MPLSGSFTSNFQNAVLDTLSGKGILDAPLDGLKLGLFTSDPGESGGTSSELTGNGYARTAFSVGSAATNGSYQGEISNSAQIDFPAATGTWSGITHAAVFQTKSLTRSIVGLTNSNEVDAQGNGQSDTRLLLPASHSTLVDTRTVTSQTTVDPDSSDGSGDSHVLITYNGSDASFYATDLNGNATNFVRFKTGPLAGVCFDLVAEGTNTITLDSHFKYTAEDIINQDVEVRAKVTLASLSGIVHNDANAFDANSYAVSGSGFKGGSTSTCDRIYVHDSTQSVSILNCQHDPVGFTGGNGWRKSGASASADAGGAVLPPMELWNHFDQTDDDYCVLRTKQTADWTLTSQLSTTDDLVVRLAFEDSGGNAQTLSVTSGQNLQIASGDLKITLD